MFARHLRRGRIRKLATFRRFAWTRKIVKKGTPKDTFVLLGKRSKRAKDKQMNKKSLFGQKWDLRRVRALVRTCKEPQKFIEFSDSSGNLFLQSLAVWRKMDIIEFSDSSGNILIKFLPFYRESFLCHCEERSDVAISRKGNRLIKKARNRYRNKDFYHSVSIRKNLRIFLFFRKMFWKGRKFLKNYFNIRLNFIYLLYSFDGLSI